MFETITTEQNRTFKEINKGHDMICIEEVEAIIISNIISHTGKKVILEFHTKGWSYVTDGFDTEEEALKFRNEIMGWENETNNMR